MLKFRWGAGISVFPGPKTQDSRFPEKVFSEILRLASWDQEILKFQYFTEISVFPTRLINMIYIRSSIYVYAYIYNIRPIYKHRF